MKINIAAALRSPFVMGLAGGAGASLGQLLVNSAVRSLSKEPAASPAPPIERQIASLEQAAHHLSQQLDHAAGVLDQQIERIDNVAGKARHLRVLARDKSDPPAADQAA